MANTPAQLPNIDLPGAEYLSLAPNRTVALQGRRRVVAVSSPATSAGASTNNVTGTLTQVLESTFTNTSGIYIHFYWAAIGPSLPGLTITAVFGGLTLAAAPFPDLPLGQPTLTSPIIPIGTVVLSDRDKLISAKDVTAAGIALGQTITQTLQLQTQIVVNNTTTGAITFTVRAGIIYTRLDGLTE